MQAQPLRRRLLLLAAAAGVGLLVLAQEQRAQAERAALEVSRALGTAVDAELRGALPGDRAAHHHS